MTPKVSVIVPVYNAGEYIERCCQALLSQTLDELEIIFVNDNSTDNSVEIIQKSLKEFPNRADATKIINHSSNCGVGSARKTGNSYATGEYIIHCDADDYPDINMYQTMYDKAMDDNADIVICSYKCGEKIVELNFNNTQIPSFNISPIEGAVWNKLIRRKLLEKNSITFSSDLILGEDFLYVTKAWILSQRTSYVPIPLYTYTIENNLSITRNFNEKKCKSIVSVATRMEDFLRCNNLLDMYFIHLNYLKFQSKAFYLIFPETRNLIKFKNTFPESNRYVSVYPISLYQKICANLIKYRLGWVASIILKIKDLKRR